MECPNLLFVLCGVKGTGGVQQTASRFETGQGVSKNALLDISQIGNLFGPEPPTGVNAAAQHTGIGAGNIEKDSIETAMPADRGFHGPVKHFRFCNAEMLLFEVFDESGETLFVGVGAEQGAVVFHCRPDEGGFATWGGAGVENDLAWLGGEKFYREPGRGVLHVDQTFFCP